VIEAGELPALHGAAGEELIEDRRAAGTNLLHELEVGKLQRAVDVRRGVRRRIDGRDGVGVRRGRSRHHDAAKTEAQCVRKDLARSGALDRVRGVVVMRLPLLGWELVALADFRPVIVVDDLLRPRLLVEVR
jgi:hypothetical protein